MWHDSRNLNEQASCEKLMGNIAAKWKLDHRLVIVMALTCELVKLIIHCDSETGSKNFRMYISIRVDLANPMRSRLLSEHPEEKH